MKKLTALLILALILISVYAQQTYTFVAEEFPPYEFSKGGTPAGMDVEVIGLICKEAGIKYKIEFLPWERCLLYMKNGTRDGIFAILKTEERKSFLNYSAEPISMDKRIIIVKKGLKGITKLSDLSTKTVGVVRGNAYGGGFDTAKMEKDISSDNKMLCEKFKAGRVDVIAVNEFVAKHYLKDVNYDVAFVISTEPFYIGFSKTFPIEQFNKAMLKTRGEKALIWNKYK